MSGLLEYSDLDRLIMSMGKPDPYAQKDFTAGHKGVSDLRGAVMDIGGALRDLNIPMGIGNAAGDALYSMGTNTPGQLGAGIVDASGMLLDAAGLGSTRLAREGIENLVRQRPFLGSTVDVTQYGAGGPQRAPMFGTGIQSEEAARVTTGGDPYRMSLYRTGTPREPGLAPEAHSGKVKRVLVDENKIKKMRSKARANVLREEQAASKGRWTPVASNNDIMNEMERLVQRAGYKGYGAGNTITYFDEAYLPHPTRSIAKRGKLTRQEIEAQVQASPGGSIRPGSGDMPTQGIAVATQGNEVIVPGRASADQILDYMETNRPALNKSGHYMGWWYDKDSNQTFLDVSQVLPDTRKGRAQAKALGEWRNQLAAYDIKADDEIPMFVRPAMEKYAAWRKQNASTLPAMGRIGPSAQRGAAGFERRSANQPQPMNEVERRDDLQDKFREELGKWQDLRDKAVADPTSRIKPVRYDEPVSGATSAAPKTRADTIREELGGMSEALDDLNAGRDPRGYELAGEMEGATPENVAMVRKQILGDISAKQKELESLSTAKGQAFGQRGAVGNLAAKPRPAEPEAPFPQYADEYPAVPPRELKVDKKSGKEYLARGSSPETQEFLKARAGIQKDIEAGNYQPYFDSAARFDASPERYPMRVDTRTEGWPKKPETIEKWRKEIQTDEARDRLQGAFDAGVSAGYHDRWYEMGQLEKAFIDELGPEAGPAMFRERFSDAMASTTGGADPGTNLVSAAYGNFMKTNKRPLPESAGEMPVPTKGLYLSGNMRMYDNVINQGKGLGIQHPKRHNFAANFGGHKEISTIDEQMTDLITPGKKAPSNNTYGIYEELVAEMAAKNGVSPREFQDVAWGGKKTMKKGAYTGKPMIDHVSEAIERTSRLTGMSPEEVLKRGIIRGEIPVYGLTGAAVTGLLGGEERGQEDVLY